MTILSASSAEKLWKWTVSKKKLYEIVDKVTRLVFFDARIYNSFHKVVLTYMHCSGPILSLIGFTKYEVINITCWALN